MARRTIAVFVVLVATGSVLLCWWLYSPGDTKYAPKIPHEHLKNDLYMIQSAIEYGYVEDDAPRELRCVPAGGIADLENWLTLLYQASEGRSPVFRARHTSLTRVGNDGQVMLCDPWGNRLVYEAPSSSPAFAVRLYSLGPNGRDDGGSGDDVDASIEKLPPRKRFTTTVDSRGEQRATP